MRRPTPSERRADPSDTLSTIIVNSAVESYTAVKQRHQGQLGAALRAGKARGHRAERGGPRQEDSRVSADLRTWTRRRVERETERVPTGRSSGAAPTAVERDAGARGYGAAAPGGAEAKPLACIRHMGARENADGAARGIAAAIARSLMSTQLSWVVEPNVVYA